MCFLSVSTARCVDRDELVGVDSAMARNLGSPWQCTQAVENWYGGWEVGCLHLSNRAHAAAMARATTPEGRLVDG